MRSTPARSATPPTSEDPPEVRRPTRHSTGRRPGPGAGRHTRRCPAAAGTTAPGGAGRRRRRRPPSAAASAAGPSRRPRRARRPFVRRGSSHSGWSMTSPTASRSEGSTTPAATQASSRRRRSSPAEPLTVVRHGENRLALARPVDHHRRRGPDRRMSTAAVEDGTLALLRVRTSSGRERWRARRRRSAGRPRASRQPRLDEPAEVREVPLPPARLARGSRPPRWGPPRRGRRRRRNDRSRRCCGARRPRGRRPRSARRRSCQPQTRARAGSWSSAATSAR